MTRIQPVLSPEPGMLGSTFQRVMDLAVRGIREVRPVFGIPRRHCCFQLDEHLRRLELLFD